MKRLAFILFAAFFLPEMLGGESSLTFGGATSNQVNHGSAAMLDNLQEFSYVGWMRPTTFGNGRIIMSKSNTLFFRNTGTGGNVTFFRQRASGTPSQYVTSSSPSVINTWNFFCVTYSTFASPTTHIYFARQGVPIFQPSYATASDGVGSFASDGAQDLQIGNAPALVTSFQGQIAYPRVFNKKLSQDECQEQQFSMGITTNTVLAVNLGFDGVNTQYDLSGNGNNGTVSGPVSSLLGPPVYTR